MNDYEQLCAELLKMRRRMRRQTGINALLAVVVLAFGGATAAYAVTLAPANSVNTAAIIDRTIGTPDVKVGAFAGQTILDNSMTGLDINESTLSIPGGVINDNSLTGADIDEATLVLTCLGPSFSKTKLGALCFEGEANPAWQSTARETCVSQGMRLPSISEAKAIGLATNDTSKIWADVTYTVPPNEFGVVASGVEMISNMTTLTLNPYRCVWSAGVPPEPPPLPVP